MSTPTLPPPAQLLFSVFSARWEAFWPDLRTVLEQRFGPADHVSALLSFSETTYYHQEFGAPLTRRIVGCARLVPQDALQDVKLWCHDREREAVRDGKRLFNIDPGLLTQERLVLATGKNFSHRIYLGQGIFADLTLLYQGGGWRSLPWTFPDYAGSVVQAELTAIRQQYRKKLRHCV